MTIAIRTTIRGIFSPPKNENPDFTSALAAIDRQRVARIVKAAVYIFATVTTAVSIMLTEAAVITWPIAIPTLLVTLAAWGVFWRLNRLDDRYVEELDDTRRMELAKKELERLLFTQTLDTFPDSQSLSKAFENINKLLSCEAFSQEFLKNIREIKERAPTSTKTLCDTAQELCTPLSIKCTRDEVEKGRYGNPSRKRNLELDWSGKRDDAITIKLSSSLEKG